MKSTTNGTTAGTNGGRKNGHSIRMQTMEKVGRDDAPDSGLDRRQLLSALRKFQKGSFDVRLPEHWTGLDGKIADTFNDVVELQPADGRELERLSAASSARKAASRSAPRSATSRGAWAASVESVNTLIGDLVHPTSETARVIGAVAKGDLSQTMALEIDGRPLRGRVPAHGEDGQHDGRPARARSRRK